MVAFQLCQYKLFSTRFYLVMPKIKNNPFHLIKLILIYGLLMFFCYLMLLITLQYIPIDFNAAFLVTKQDEIIHMHYQVAFFTHVYTAIFTLFFGMFQFSDYLRKKYSKLHRISGGIYIFILLVFSAPSGFIMGLYGNGGLFSKISFCLQAILWFTFTLLAFVHIRKRNYKNHEVFMILSYALTLSAVSLRLFKWIIVNTLYLPPMTTYKIVVWLGWLVNVFIALVIIKSKNRRAK